VPLVAELSERIDLAGLASKRLPLAGKSVLIIEDEALIAMGFESCLQDAGAVVKIASSIASAQSALEAGIPFDAAVVDLVVAGECRGFSHIGK
jgi:DNA-binding NtrC family response regulator